jgi:hypothetical protein
MKKNNTLLLLGAAAVGLYIFKDKIFSGGSTPGEDGGLDAADAGKTDAVIDTQATGMSIPAAIEQAKAIAQGVKDIKVLIKTPTGEKNIEYTKGEKTPSARKLRRKAKRSSRIAKRKRKNRKKAKIVVQPTQSSFMPFSTPAPSSSYAPGANPYFTQF